jgi:TatD DNase family protein
MQFLNVHTHFPPENDDILAIRSVFFEENWNKTDFRKDKNNRNSVRFSVGIHPWHLPLDRENAMRRLRFEASQDDVLAVGEAGLDKIKGGNFEEQVGFFMENARLAEEVEKPLVIHCVRANEEILAIKKLIKPREAWIMHGFSGHPNTAKSLITNGLYLSFGHHILKNENAVESLKNVPADRFFLETDTREDFFIDEIYETAARIRGISMQNLQEIIWGNFVKCFGHAALDF